MKAPACVVALQLLSACARALRAADPGQLPELIRARLDALRRSAVTRAAPTLARPRAQGEKRSRREIDGLPVVAALAGRRARAHRKSR